MAANISQAEKWRLWKEKMQASVSNKSANKCLVEPVEPIAACAGSGSNPCLGNADVLNGAISPDKEITKTKDKTLDMIEEFVKKCRSKSDKNNDDANGVTGAPKVKRPVPVSIKVIQVSGSGERETHKRINTSEQSITSLCCRHKTQTATKSDVDTLVAPSHKPSSISIENISSTKNKFNTSPINKNPAIKRRFDNKSLGNNNPAIKNISDNIPNGTCTKTIPVPNKRLNTESVICESAKKKTCTSILQVHGNKDREINNETTKQFDTNEKRANKIEKPRRTVRFVEENDDKSEEKDKDAVVHDKDSDNNAVNHDAVMEALQREGRRIMVGYLAEYESSSDESLEDGEIVRRRDDTPIENVKFTVHLSSSLKNVKPYRCVILDVIETNEGKSYSATTGRFIAPQRGMYAFFLTITSSKKEQPEVSIIHNFHPVDSSKIKTNKQEDGDMQTRTDAILLSLARNDEIWLLNITRIARVAQLAKCHFLSFSGFMLKL